MKTTIKGKVPRTKQRVGVMPTRVEKNLKTYSRKTKHKSKGIEGQGPSVI